MSRTSLARYAGLLHAHLDGTTRNIRGEEVATYADRARAKGVSLRVEQPNGSPVLWVHDGGPTVYASGWRA